MTESLSEVKQRLRTKYLGREGIHGLGVRRTHNALCVYVHAPLSAALLEELQREAATYGIEIIEEEAPKLSSG